MCANDKACDTCRSRKSKAEFAGNKAQLKKLHGQDMIVVDVIMAKADVVMNGGLLPEEEYDPFAWNGVPVTIGHPEASDHSFLSARDPQVCEEWTVGNIYNAKVVDGSLRGEAWCSVARLEEIRPGLAKKLAGGEPIDVSTGYLCDPEPAGGVSNGEQYKEIHRNILPDHLALLPEDVGACSWEDGCGVRQNGWRSALDPKKVLEFLANRLGIGKNEDTAPENPEKKPEVMSVTDFVAMESNPFSETDVERLSKMDPTHFAALVSAYDVPPMDPEEKKEPPVTNEDPPAVDDKEPAFNKKAKTAKNGGDAVLTANQKVAVAWAEKAYKAHRSSLIAKITANSTMKAEDLEKMDADTLETIANGLKPLPTPSYAGRAVAVENAEQDEDVDLPQGALDFLAARNKKKGVA